MAGRRTYRTRAIVLDRTKLGEQDLILTLLAADGRQLRAVAKGARRPGGRLAARVELFCETDFLLAVGRSLDVVSEAALVQAHARLRGDYDRVAAASAVAELARLTCFEDAPDGFLYPICARALAACEEAPDRARLDLVAARLRVEGARPRRLAARARRLLRLRGRGRGVLLGHRRGRALRELRARGGRRPGGVREPGRVAARPSGQHLRRASRRVRGRGHGALSARRRPRLGRHPSRLPPARNGVLPLRVNRPPRSPRRFGFIVLSARWSPIAKPQVTNCITDNRPAVVGNSEPKPPGGGGYDAQKAALRGFSAERDARARLWYTTAGQYPVPGGPPTA